MLHYGLIHSWGETVKNTLYYMFLTVLIVIISGAFKHNGITPLFFWNEQAVTRESLFWGFMLGILLMLLSFIFKSMSRNLPTDRLLYICRRLSPTSGIYIALFIRLIPTFKLRFMQMNRTQKSIGYYATASFFEKLSGYVKTVYGCAIWSFDNCFHKSDIMRARGFHLKKKTVFQFYNWRLADTLLSIFMTILFGLFILFYHQLTFFYFPFTKELDLSNKISYVIIIIALIPVVIEIKERIKWHYYNLKM